MRILFAVPDRDLLNAYRQILTGPEREAETTFDGTQVLSRLSEKHYELLILSDDIARIGWKEILRYCREESVKVILITTDAPSRYKGRAEETPDALIRMPFEPDELLRLTESVVTI